MGMTLFQLTADMAAIEDALIESGGELTPEIEAALTETQDSLAVKVDGYNALIQKFGRTADVLKAEIDRLGKLKKTAENAEKRVKQHVCDTMGAFGIEKLEGQLCKMTRRRTQRVETNDEMLKAAYQRNIDELNAILPPYLTVKLEVSKTGIKEFQKEEGLLPAGAEMVEAYSLMIR